MMIWYQKVQMYYSCISQIKNEVERNQQIFNDIINDIEEGSEKVDYKQLTQCTNIVKNFQWILDMSGEKSADIILKKMVELLIF